jgi:hypothetical protein
VFVRAGVQEKPTSCLTLQHHDKHIGIVKYFFFLASVLEMSLFQIFGVKKKWRINTDHLCFYNCVIIYVYITEIGVVLIMICYESYLVFNGFGNAF